MGGMERRWNARGVLTQAWAQLCADLDELLKSMDTIPSEQRHGPAWEANTNRFLELVERSGDIARKLQLGSDAIKKGATGRKPS